MRAAEEYLRAPRRAGLVVGVPLARGPGDFAIAALALASGSGPLVAAIMPSVDPHCDGRRARESPCLAVVGPDCGRRCPAGRVRSPGAGAPSPPAVPLAGHPWCPGPPRRFSASRNGSTSMALEAG